MSLHQCLSPSKPAASQSAAEQTGSNRLVSSQSVFRPLPSALQHPSPAIPSPKRPARETVRLAIAQRVSLCWSRRALGLLPVLLLPLTAGCSIEEIAAPTQTPAVSAQAAEQSSAPSLAPATGGAATGDTSTSGDTSSTATGEATTEGTVAERAEPPLPQKPQLMSKASSTAVARDVAPLPEQDFNQGPLRIGNQTPHPLRIAFLAQGQTLPGEAQAAEAEADGAEIANAEAADSEAAASGAARTIQDPFHWDFAPEEGGRDGLLLALPEQDLVLQNGDVIVAFAQDGSQRYWGPYVVGQTSLPHWNGDRKEWQLLVQP